MNIMIYYMIVLAKRRQRIDETHLVCQFNGKWGRKNATRLLELYELYVYSCYKKRDIDFLKRNILQYLVACKPDCCSHINIMRNNDEVRHKDSI